MRMQAIFHLLVFPSISLLFVGCATPGPGLSETDVAWNNVQWLIAFVLVGLIVLWLIIKSAVRQGSIEAQSQRPKPPDEAEKQLIDYILNARAHGQSEDQIKEALLHNGWSSDYLDDIWERIPPPPKPPR